MNWANQQQPSQTGQGQQRPVCQFYQMNGHCRFGNNCYKSHDVDPPMSNFGSNNMTNFNSGMQVPNNFNNQGTFNQFSQMANG